MAYETLAQWRADCEENLLQAHQLLMQGLIDHAGHYRQSGVGVMQGKQVIHMAPPANRLGALMEDLLQWLAQSEEHPLIRSSIFHYEFEFIHPFADGNGRMGRLWQTLILSQWKPIFSYLPVESLVYANQDAYYQALQYSTDKTDSAPFIEFILHRILEACKQATPQVTPQVKDLMQLLKQREMSKAELMAALQLNDVRSFRKRYLLPALSAGLIVMTLPDKPSSPAQKYRLNV